MTTTATEQLPATPDEARRSAGLRAAGLRFAGAFAIGLVLAGSLAFGAIYAFERQYEQRILPGVRVGTTDLSGATIEEARTRLSRAYASLGTGRIVVAWPGGEASITYAEIGRTVDLDALASAALTAGRAGSTPLERILGEARTLLRGVAIEPRVTVDATLLDERLAAIARPMNREPIDARVVATPAGFALAGASEGRRLDPSAARDAVLNSLVRLDAPAELRIELVPEPVRPAVDDAAASLARVRAERIAQELVLGLGEERWTIPAETVRGWIGFAVTPDGWYDPVIDRAAVLAALEPLAPQINRPPKDATFLIGKGDQVVGVRPGVDGRALDPAASADRVVAALLARAVPDSGLPVVEPAVTVTRPALTTEQASAVAPTMSRISSWTTWYSISERNGFGANIEVPARLIDGTVIAPGGVFDFWDVVGDVTVEKGYRQGGAIINGRTEPQGALAGGICSTSTTVFNAALRAGLQMGARRNHYYYIDRYPLGLDATVFISASGSKQTVSFTNDTPYPLLIRGFASGRGTSRSVTFEIWSVPTGRTVSLTTPIVKNRKPATTITQTTDTLPAGQRKQVEYPVEGKDVWVTRTVRDADGNIVHEETYYSHYARIDGLILVGTGGSSPSPTPSPTPSPGPTPTPTPAP
ncbi:MAG: VanW family protein [Chloroflexota bacterium]